MKGRPTRPAARLFACWFVIGLLPAWGWVICSLLGLRAAAAEPPLVDDLLDRAQKSMANRKPHEALALAAEAVGIAPKNPQAYYVRGRIHDALKQFDKALADFDEVLRLEPRALEVYHHRGAAHFKLGKFAEAISDFDKVLARFPDQVPHHWQRGIAYYYAGRYEEGRKQFEAHQTVNSNDVENAAWHFLCQARAGDVGRARGAMLKVGEDRRIPMKEIYAFYAGTAAADDVIAAARAGDPPTAELNQRLFYAHLYLGLYYDVRGDETLARQHIDRATDTYRQDHYMGDVARVQARVLAERK